MSTMIKTTVVAALIGLSLAACGKKDDAPSGTATGSASLTGAAPKSLGSCNKLTNVGKCTEYDMSKDTLGMNKGGCEATDGKWQTTACPSDKQFASCATSETKIIYYAGTTAPGSLITVDEEFAKLDCELMSGKLTVTGSAHAAAPADTGNAKPAAPTKKAAGPAPKPKK